MTLIAVRVAREGQVQDLAIQPLTDAELETFAGREAGAGIVRFTAREWALIRLAVLGRRVPLATVGLVPEGEWEALQAKLRDAAEEAR